MSALPNFARRSLTQLRRFDGRRLGAAAFSTAKHASEQAAAGGSSHLNASSAGGGPSFYSAAARARANAANWSASISRDELHRVMNETLQNRSRKLAISAAAATAAIGLVAYSFRKEGRAAVVEELSDVASRSLSDEKMQAQAQLVTIQTLQALLEHGETVQRTVTFLSTVSEHEQTREALVSLLVTALKNPAVVNEALQLVLWILDDERARENLVTCLMAALTNPRFEEAAAEFAVRWLAHDSVKEVVTQVFKEASLQVLEDDSVRNNSEQFVHQLLQEPQLQAKTSEHLWGAVKGLIYTPKPKPVPAVGTVAQAAGKQVAAASTAAPSTVAKAAAAAAAVPPEATVVPLAAQQTAAQQMAAQQTAAQQTAAQQTAEPAVAPTAPTAGAADEAAPPVSTLPTPAVPSERRQSQHLKRTASASMSPQAPHEDAAAATTTAASPGTRAEEASSDNFSSGLQGGVFTIGPAEHQPEPQAA